MLLLTTIFPSSLIQAKSIDPPPSNDPVKPWTVTFNGAVGSDENNLKRIYVQSPDNTKIEISYKISADLEKVTVIPKNPYIFGDTYSLVIPKGFKSAQGKETTEDTTMAFQIERKVISDISATTTPLLTNIIVKGADNISKVTVSINNSEAVMLNSVGTHFSKGFLGLMKGGSANNTSL